jgi:type II secretory pathway component PulF
MVGKVADFYEAELDNLADGLSSLMELLIMAVPNVFVGGLVIAMYLPIFKLGGGLATRPSARWKDDFITSLGIAIRAS